MSRLKTWTAGLVVLLSACGGLAIVAPDAIAAGMQPAHGSSVRATGRLVDYQTGRCLDSNYNGTVYTNPCWRKDNYQIWDLVVDLDAGRQELMDNQTGRCLQGGIDRRHIRTTPCPAGNWAFDVARNPRDRAVGNIFDLAYGEAVALDSNYSGHAYEGASNRGRYQEWHATGTLGEYVNF
jgi:hypothetical protein